MEILRFRADEFCRISGILSQTLTFIRCGKPVFNVAHWEMIGGALGSLQRECEVLDLRSALAHVKRLRGLVEAESIEPSMFERFLTEIQVRIVDELSERWFVHVPPSSVDLYRQESPVFGGLAEQKFPQMAEDISEAAKCLALNRNTAATFHLMRIMELAVESFETGGCAGF